MKLAKTNLRNILMVGGIILVVLIIFYIINNHNRNRNIENFLGATESNLLFGTNFAKQSEIKAYETNLAKMRAAGADATIKNNIRNKFGNTVSGKSYKKCLEMNGIGSPQYISNITNKHWWCAANSILSEKLTNINQWQKSPKYEPPAGDNSSEKSVTPLDALTIKTYHTK